MTSYDNVQTAAYRLPLPADEPVAPERALRRLRARRPEEVGEAPGDVAVPDEADAVIWRPSLETLEALPAPWDFEPWRDVVGERKLALEIPSGAPLRWQRLAVQALSEAGFVLLRREILDSGPNDTDPPRVWLVAKRDDDYRVRLCRQEDEAAILELFAPLFHNARSAEHWRWKYLENPWGRRWISLAVAGERELAAHYAGYPVPFVRWNQDERNQDEREDLLAVQIGDTMTAPEHRTVGLGWTSLLGRAVRHHFARFGREGVAFYYGFNTGKIRNFNFRFIQGRWAGTAGFYRRPSEGLPISEGASAERLDLASLPEQELDDFFQRVGPAHRLLVRRDAAWLRWRYGACPDLPSFFAMALRSRKRLVGWAVFRRHVDPATDSNQLRWVDALFDPAHASSSAALLAEALRQPDAGDAEEITAWFSPRPDWWVEALRDLGFERVTEPDDLGLIYLPFDDPRADETFLDLYYTWGDSDLT